MHTHNLVSKIRISGISRELKILGLAFFIYYLSWGAINPYFSIYIHNVTGSYSITGFLYASMFLVQVLVAMPFGDLLDKIGRKNVTMFSLLNYVGVGLVYFVSSSFIGILTGRIWNAFAASGVWIGGKTLARDLSEEGEEGGGMGFFTLSWILSCIFGPLLAIPIVLYFRINALFLLLPTCAIISSLIVKRGVGETGGVEGFKDGLKDLVFKDKVFYKELRDFFADKKDMKISVLHFIGKFNFSVAVMILGLFIRELGASLWQVAIIYSVYYIPYVTSFKFGSLADKHGRKKIIGIGSVLSSVFFFALFLTESVWLAFIFSAFVSLGISMLSPAIQGLITKIGRGKEGETTGLYQTIASLGTGLGPLIAGIISDMYSIGHSFLLCGAVSLLAVVIIFTME